MSENEAKDKGKGESIVKGSLGALLASYGNSSSSDLSEDEELDKDKRCATNAKTMAHTVPNPLFNTEKGPTIVENPHYRVGNDDPATVVVKQEREDEPGTSSALMMNDNRPITGIQIKEEPKEESVNCDNVISPTAAPDFATLNDKSKRRVEMELSVEDFLPSNEYSEARVVKVESGTSDSESDSADSETDESEEESATGEGNDPEKLESGKKKVEGPKAKGELSLYDLPPIEDLHISVPHDECKPIGLIKSVVEPLVIVEAYLETPALDLDSVLFLEKGDRALGRIFDVIGPVKQPMYCVRFNSKEHIEKNKVEVGMPVFCAPKTPYTTYVFLAQLRKLKGSDASWLNDIEPPVEEVEYSDDEMERFAKKKKRNRKFLKARATEEDATYKEDENVNVQNTRGQKRQFNQNGQHYAFTNTTYGGTNGPVTSANPNGCPPFIPPMIPGFTPFGPPSTYPGYPTPPEVWHQAPNHMNQQRGFPRPRGRGFQRFRPPLGMQPAYPSEFQQNPYRQIQDTSHWGSWRPPPQWQNQNSTNFNFGGGGQNPYPQTFGMVQTRPLLPPPPPPPPPPGH